MPVLAGAGGAPLSLGGHALGVPAAGAVAARGVVGVEIAPDRIFQRVGAVRSVAFTGAFTAGSALDVQVFRDDTGAVVADWTPAVLAGGAFQITLSVPQGGWHRWRVRDRTRGEVVWSSANRFAVGALIALLGRSNMAFSFAYNGAVGDPTSYPLPPGEAWADKGYSDAARQPLYRHYNGGWKALHLGDNGTADTHDGGPRGDPPRLFALAMQAALPGLPIGLLPYAVPGTDLGSWLPGSGPNWQNFAAAISAIDCGADHEMALWHHGEDEGAGVDYAGGLSRIWSGLLSLAGRTRASYRFGVSLVGPEMNAPQTAVDRLLQLGFIGAHADEGVFMACNWADASLGGDTVHPVFTDRVRQFRRYAVAVAHQMGAAAHGAEGPAITGATRRGAVIQVSIAHNGGTALRTADGGATGASIGGFRVFVNGAAVAIASTALAGGGIALTLAATPAAGSTVTLDHQAADAPYGASTAPAAVVTDDQALPAPLPYATYFGGIGAAPDPAWTDARGLPLQPTAAITVSGS